MHICCRRDDTRCAHTRSGRCKRSRCCSAAQQRTAQWDELARCENGGDWNVVDRYGGGLGIFIGTWHTFGGDEFASNPGYTTKEQQIIVAERIYARHGISGWGCKVHMSWR